MKFTAFILSILFTVAVHADCVNKISVGNLNVVVDGKTQQLPVVQSGGTTGPRVTVDGNNTELSHDARVYIGSECDGQFKPTSFYLFKLMDKTITYTADLSQVGCGCNAALYLISMPAYNSSQSPDPTRCGDYYCDANQVCGVYCPEIDLFEANNRNIHITPHSCDSPQGKYYSHCDGGGYSLSAYDKDKLSFGPSDQHLIDTTKPFRVSHTFESTDGTLSKMTSTLSQGDKKFQMVHDKQSYLNSLTDAVNQGMAIAMSFWGDGGGEMSWLDVPPCDQSVACATEGTKAIFGDIIVA